MMIVDQGQNTGLCFRHLAHEKVSRKPVASANTVVHRRLRAQPFGALAWSPARVATSSFSVKRIASAMIAAEQIAAASGRRLDRSWWVARRVAISRVVFWPSDQHTGPCTGLACTQQRDSSHAGTGDSSSAGGHYRRLGGILTCHWAMMYSSTRLARR